ncbi:replication initiation protein [Telluribacter sp. SYSU D00476]|uniref:replication initiation protein n=1 Tax=Telluribacter sp. SYSU D00476 TaxID=2811430 RepID=UPI001FF3FF3A|nr:replication initiation protein [Telluribacter sp. SYSU D00476]
MAKGPEESKRSKKYKSITLIKKSNELVEARYRFTLWEIRLFEKMVKEIHKDDTEFKQVDIFIRDFMSEYDKKPNGKLYEEIRKAEELLLNRVVHIPYTDENGEGRLKSYPLMAMVDRPNDLKGYMGEGGYLSLKFNNELSPYLLQLKQRYTQYDPEITMQIDSTYVIRTYELLKLYEYVGSKTLNFDEFREMIGAKEYDSRLKKVIKDTLKTWEHVKQRVLEPAYKEINSKADITFDYEPQYERRPGAGRKKVVGIRFFNIQAKRKKQVGAAEENTVVEPILDISGDFEAVYKQVKEYVSSTTVEKWFRDFPQEQIRRGINYTFSHLKAGHTIHNIGGFLQAMVAIRDLHNPYEKQEQKAADGRKKQSEHESRAGVIKELELKKEQLRKAQFDRQFAIACNLLEKKASLRERLIEKAQHSLFARYNKDESYEANLEKAPFQAFLVGFVMGEHPKPFEAHTNEFKALIDAVEQEIGEMHSRL